MDSDLSSTGMFNGWASLNATSYDKLQSGEYKVLIQVSPEPIKELGGIPSIAQLAKTDEQKRLVRLTTTVPYQYARSFLVRAKGAERAGGGDPQRGIRDRP